MFLFHFYQAPGTYHEDAWPPGEFGWPEAPAALRLLCRGSSATTNMNTTIQILVVPVLVASAEMFLKGVKPGAPSSAWYVVIY